MSQLLKKIVIILSILVFVLFIAILIAAWYLGAFSPVTLSLEERDASYYIATNQRIRYADIPRQLAQIKSHLKAEATNYKYDCALIYSDLTTMALKDVVAQAVLLGTDSLEVAAPLQIGNLAAGKIAVASIEANPAIAVFKIYPALNDWLLKNQETYDVKFPMIEIYDPPYFTVQMPVVLK